MHKRRPGDHFVGRKLMMHIASCTADEVRIPFAADNNRLRTIIICSDSTGAQRNRKKLRVTRLSAA